MNRRLSLSALGLMVAILATASVMFVTHLRSLGRDRERMSRELEMQGHTIVRTLESGARTGMMMRWEKEQLQAFLEEATGIPEIAFVGIFDSSGEAVAVDSPEIAAPPWPDAGEVAVLLERRAPLFAYDKLAEGQVFVVSKRFSPVSRHGRMMGRMMGPGASRPREGPDWAVVLGLYTGPWEKALAEGRRQTLLSLLVILFSGTIALYLGILLQNYFVIRRTLSDMRAYAQNILENMADGLVSVDLEGRVSTYNPEAARILRAGEEDLAQKQIRDLLPEARSILDGAFEGRSEREEGETSLGGEGADRRPTGIAVSPLRNEKGAVSGAVIVLRDLTEVRRLEEKIREAEKLAAIGQMAATVAHELRNPLSSLRGFARLFEGKFPEGSLEAGYASLMVREVDRLNRTITDLLYYSRPLQLSRGAVAVGDLLGETVNLLEQDFLARGQVIKVVGAEGVEVEADADQLSRVFLNILLNAHQAAGEGARITIEVSARGGRCRIEVHDSGPGMTREEAARAFEPFFTTREKGSGLGLAIVKKIVDLHGGDVTLRSREGEGTTVAVELPTPAPREEAVVGRN